ncbi:hypothetical protein JIN84_08110 [Luteolibacter yonseiensis]|uniref:Lipoprotein n=1 Tax=Luteolibacter yonseiensis TaxID=1144680 RepID=A0A934R5E4_9BACT|nr:hypothetical protein [Luteolibacter yonseiensis]MBK1815575.1 hypothetical protein [Luteolibacter yonseiensis]
MIPRVLPFFIALPLLLISCDRKNPAAPVTRTPAEISVALAKRGYIPPAGSRIRRELTIVMNDSVLRVEAGGKRTLGITSNISTDTEDLEFISDTKVRRIASRLKTGRAVIGGTTRTVPDSVSDFRLDGKPVIIEKKDGVWMASMETGTADLQARRFINDIAEAFNLESDVETYGETPRKVGEKWDVHPTRSKILGEVRNLSGSQSMEFVRIEDFRGTPCAMLRAVIDLKGEGGEFSGQSVRMRFRGDVTILRSLKDMLDLQSSFSGIVTLDSTTAPGTTLHVEGTTYIMDQTTVTPP